MNSRQIVARRGDVTIGAILSILLMTGAVVLLSRMNTHYTEMKRQAVVAGQMQDVVKAAMLYCEANYATLVAAADATTPASFTFANIQDAGFLSDTAVNKNDWGQSYGFYVLEPSSNNLQLIVLTEGGRSYDAAHPAFATLQVPGAAQLVGAKGGYVPTGLMASEPETTLQGVGGGWVFDFTGNSVPNPGAGHLGSMVWLASSGAASDYLYRVSVPGRPELNQMQTVLDMGGHDITMGDAGIGGGDGEGLAVLNFEDHAVAEFACADDDDLGGQLFYVDRGPEADADEALKSGGLYICRAGELRKVYDEGNIVFPDGASVPVGTVIANSSSALPGNESNSSPTQAACVAATSESQAESLGCTWVEADGSSLRTTAYPNLFAAIGTTYGGGGGFFTLPDLRGEFIRGWDHGRGADSGRSFASSQSWAIEQIYGQFGYSIASNSRTTGVFKIIGSGGSAAYGSGSRSLIEFDASRVVNTDTETRPRNVAMMYLVKAL